MELKVVFPLEQDDDGYPPFQSEVIDVSEIEVGLGRVISIPLFVPELAVGDLIHYHEIDGEVTYIETLAHRGNSTLRVILEDESDTDSLIASLGELGCNVGKTNISGYLALDVPVDADFHAVRNLLAGAEAAGTLEYEESYISVEHVPIA